MSTPSSNRKRATAKTPGFARGLFGYFSNTIDKSNDGEYRGSDKEEGQRILFVNNGTDLISGTPQVNRRDIAPQELTLRSSVRKVLPKTSSTDEPSPWLMQPNNFRTCEISTSRQSSPKNSAVFSLGVPSINNTSLRRGRIRDGLDSHKIHSGRSNYKPTQMRRLFKRSAGSGISSGETPSMRSKEVAQKVREAMDQFQPNQVLLAATISENSSANGYTHFCSRGRLLSKRSRFRPFPTNAAVVISGTKHSLASDDNNGSTKRQKVTFEQSQSFVTGSSISSSPSRSSQLAFEELPTPLFCKMDGPTELVNGMELHDWIKPEIDNVQRVNLPPARDMRLVIRASKLTDLILLVDNEKNEAGISSKHQSKKAPSLSSSSSKEPKRVKANGDDISSSDISSTTQSMKVASNWGGIFASQKNQWQCRSCLLKNNLDMAVCPSCGEERPQDGNTQPFSALPSSSTTSSKPAGSIGSGGFSFATKKVGTSAPVSFDTHGRDELYARHKDTASAVAQGSNSSSSIMFGVPSNLRSINENFGQRSSVLAEASPSTNQSTGLTPNVFDAVEMKKKSKEFSANGHGNKTESGDIKTGFVFGMGSAGNQSSASSFQFPPAPPAKLSVALNSNHVVPDGSASIGSSAITPAIGKGFSFGSAAISASAVAIASTPSDSFVFPSTTQKHSDLKGNTPSLSSSSNGGGPVVFSYDATSGADAVDGKTFSFQNVTSFPSAEEKFKIGSDVTSASREGRDSKRLAIDDGSSFGVKTEPSKNTSQDHVSPLLTECSSSAMGFQFRKPEEVAASAERKDFASSRSTAPNNSSFATPSFVATSTTTATSIPQFTFGSSNKSSHFKASGLNEESNVPFGSTGMFGTVGNQNQTTTSSFGSFGSSSLISDSAGAIVPTTADGSTVSAKVAPPGFMPSSAATASSQAPFITGNTASSGGGASVPFAFGSTNAAANTQQSFQFGQASSASTAPFGQQGSGNTAGFGLSAQPAVPSFGTSSSIPSSSAFPPAISYGQPPPPAIGSFGHPQQSAVPGVGGFGGGDFHPIAIQSTPGSFAPFPSQFPPAPGSNVYSTQAPANVAGFAPQSGGHEESFQIGVGSKPQQRRIVRAKRPTRRP